MAAGTSSLRLPGILQPIHRREREAFQTADIARRLMLGAELRQEAGAC